VRRLHSGVAKPLRSPGLTVALTAPLTRPPLATQTVVLWTVAWHLGTAGVQLEVLAWKALHTVLRTQVLALRQGGAAAMAATAAALAAALALRPPAQQPPPAEGTEPRLLLDTVPFCGGIKTLAYEETGRFAAPATRRRTPTASRRRPLQPALTPPRKKPVGGRRAPPPPPPVGPEPPYSPPAAVQMGMVAVESPLAPSFDAWHKRGAADLGDGRGASASPAKELRML